MNYLIDNQLPIGLVRHLQSHGLQASSQPAMMKIRLAATR
jgi:hypothetical protein